MDDEDGDDVKTPNLESNVVAISVDSVSSVEISATPSVKRRKTKLVHNGVVPNEAQI